MATQGPNYPSVAADEGQNPYNDVPWDVPEDVCADDTAWAEIWAVTFDTGRYSYRLRASDFGFSIPAGAVIDGIVVEALARTTAGSAAWALAQLHDATSSLSDNRFADGGTFPASEGSIESFGGASELWGATLTPEIVNDPDFSFCFAAQATDENTKIGVQYVRMTIYYTTVTWTASLVIDSDAASTDDNDVTLTIHAEDQNGDPPDEMRFAEDAADADPGSVVWGAWEAYATTKAWQLAAQTDEDPHARGVGVEFRHT